ncbi:MAG: cob(I)yrinic acid a,c-diamide adenosyltransferase [Ignavibacterium sp.]|nr:cob(I)yrinic acid a,c-diamide adenosyltransferase [Ignavibacterium sp.]MCX7611956.1 cob(I)yrinic acid a,c-diamide adenosyltransferase [Ignavibacterium sp.]MDW8374752.1 cob(I)yrinic acid a,c-diamide adenosyltransferase [Ignavibacteriales bacterium]
MKIYTKTGDKGETGLFGGERVLKSHLRIKAYGTIDELNSFIGLTITEISSDEIKKILIDIQNKLFVVGSDLATPDTLDNKKINIPRTSQSFVSDAEKTIDEITEKLEPLRNFILPGGSKGASLLHVCRTITRRAEREVVELKQNDIISDNILVFLNRLSDLFFVLSRYENKICGISDVKWNP